MHAYVGNWSVKPASRGMSIYGYDPETGALTFEKTIHEEYSVAEQFLDREKGKLYVCDENIVRRGNIDSGLIKVFGVGEEGLTEEGETVSLLTKPAGICVDRTGKYVLVSHYGGRGYVTKLIKDEDGKISSGAVCDDAAVALYRRNEDGSLGELLDAVATPLVPPEDPFAASHEHCVVESPEGGLFIICDKGLDRIYSVALDTDNGKLSLLRETYAEKGFMPRSAVFLPGTGCLVESNEGLPLLQVYGYDNSTGELSLRQKVTLSDKEGRTVQCSDMALSSDGKILYASVRDANIIVTLRVNGDGTLEKLRTVDCAGDNPRGLCLAPDGKFLLCANINSATIATFSIGENGELTATGDVVEAVLPSSITLG